MFLSLLRHCAKAKALEKAAAVQPMIGYPSLVMAGWRWKLDPSLNPACKLDPSLTQA